MRRHRPRFPRSQLSSTLNSETTKGISNRADNNTRPPMPIHIAITRRARPGCEAEFQAALREFFQTSFAHGGVLGATMIVPPPGSDSREFGILRTFADGKERDAFYSSSIFKAWEKKCEPLTESGSWTYRELHGLEAWFRSPHNPPPRWKMAVATLLGVY